MVLEEILSVIMAYRTIVYLVLVLLSPIIFHLILSAVMLYLWFTLRLMWPQKYDELMSSKDSDETTAFMMCHAVIILVLMGVGGAIFHSIL